jgi:hypothetical protein
LITLCASCHRRVEGGGYGVDRGAEPSHPSSRHSRETRGRPSTSGAGRSLMATMTSPWLADGRGLELPTRP